MTFCTLNHSYSGILVTYWWLRRYGSGEQRMKVTSVLIYALRRYWRLFSLNNAINESSLFRVLVNKNHYLLLRQSEMQRARFEIHSRHCDLFEVPSTLHQSVEFKCNLCAICQRTFLIVWMFLWRTRKISLSMFSQM